jgi:plastocyanin
MRRLPIWGLCLALAALPAAAAVAETTSLAGRVSVEIQDLSLRDAGEVVVFLEPEEGADPIGGEALPRARVRQIGARFAPAFIAVAVGQRVDMPNDDIIFHNVFSYSAPNDFDLGLYAAGESNSIVFEHPGLVRIYCSIHEAMDGLIFVAPTRLFDVPDVRGEYEIRDVPPGRYRVHVFSERLPALVKNVEIVEGESVQLDLEIGAPSD